MPIYLGQEVGLAFLEMITRVYKEQFEAAQPEHTPTTDDDRAIIGKLQSYNVHGGPGACTVARATALGITLPPDPHRIERRSGEVDAGPHVYLPI